MRLEYWHMFVSNNFDTNCFKINTTCVTSNNKNKQYVSIFTTLSVGSSETRKCVQMDTTGVHFDIFFYSASKMFTIKQLNSVYLTPIVIVNWARCINTSSWIITVICNVALKSIYVWIEDTFENQFYSKY